MCLDTPGQAGCAQPTVLSRGPQGPGTTQALMALSPRGWTLGLLQRRVSRANENYQSCLLLPQVKLLNSFSP